MVYKELHSRYGSHVSQRVRRELSSAEFEKVPLDRLSGWLEARADAAHDAYRKLLNNPLASEHDHLKTGDACRHWREAEDLAYLVLIADDVGAAVLQAV